MTEREKKLAEFAESVVALNETYGGEDLVIAGLAEDAREALKP